MSVRKSIGDLNHYGSALHRSMFIFLRSPINLGLNNNIRLFLRPRDQAHRTCQSDYGGHGFETWRFGLDAGGYSCIMGSRHR